MTPERTHAIIVAIEKYAEGGDLHGPARDAVIFAKWLTASGVKAENIHLFASPQEDSRQGIEQLGVDIHQADHATFVKWIAKANLSGDLLLLLWGGHGLCLQEERHLVFADATKEVLYAIDWKSLRSILRNKLDFPRQLCFVDACANHAEFGSAEPKPPAVPTPRIRRAEVNQLALFAASPGQRAANPEGRGLFSKALTDVLADLNPPGVWPPDIDAIGARLNEHFACLRRSGNVKQCPAFYSFGDTHWSPQQAAIYETVIALQAASDEQTWKDAWDALETTLRMQDRARDVGAWIRDLAREPNTSLGPALAALRNEREQQLFAFVDRRALRAWLDQVEPGLARALFEENPGFARLQGLPAWAGAYQACMSLAGYSGASSPPPALEYLERVAAKIERKDLQQALTRISSEAAQKLGITAPLLEFRQKHAGKSARIPSAALVFVVRSNGGQYTFESWLWPDNDTPAGEWAPEGAYAATDVVAASSAALKSLVTRVQARVTRLRIEVALPRELLCQPVETWSVLRGSMENPAFIYYPVMVRWTDRLDDPLQRQQWEEAWAALPDQALPAPPNFIPADANPRSLSARLNKAPAARAVVALESPPPDAPRSGDVLSTVLNEGAPIILWPRGDAPHDAVCAQIRERIFSHAPREFPALVQELRREAAENEQTARVVLLYDDYSFIEDRGF